MWGHPQREPKRDSHGHHLRAQDADTERIHRRHKENDQRRHSPDRAYRSDDELRRRHKHDGDRHRYREHASRARKDVDLQRGHPPINIGERGSKASTREPYGEHRYDSPSPPRSLPPPRFDEERTDGTFTNWQKLDPSHWGDARNEGLSPQMNTQRVHRLSLPPNAQSPAYTWRDQSPQGNVGSSSPMPGHHEILNTDTNPPRISVSPHLVDYPQAPSDLISTGVPDRTRNVDMDRRPSSSGASTASWRIPSPSPTSSSVRTLGSRTYQYQPLHASEIRLVRVLPRRMWKLKCEMLHVSIHELPEYIAISYAWGDGVDTGPLVLDGATVPVAVSLRDALMAVRRREEETLVWVDALCINQQDKDERAGQVRLMGQIYSGAASVAIWIGPEYEESDLAMQLLQKVEQHAIDPAYIKSTRNSDSLALFNLFKRGYWKRLWVVQEVLLARNKTVYCGHSKFPWAVYQAAAEVFWDKDSDPHIRQGPSSFPNHDTLQRLGDESLLEVLRVCRKKISENPRDKIFGILGLLSDDTQRDFPVDYGQSVKSVYTDIVDHLISITDKLDVIRESIHFPLHVNTAGLPSWCPDWSHIPDVSGLGRALNFAASNGPNGPTRAQYRFHDERRKLEIHAIRIDEVMATGIAVGTFCEAQDYLTAFLQWRAVLLHKLKVKEGNESHPAHKSFCKTLCLGQVPPEWSEPGLWRDLCYHVFAAMLRERMPRLPVDEELKHYANAAGLIEPKLRRKFLQDHFGNRMMGRSLCITKDGLIGMGSGYMTADDLVVVPFGCSTPIILRREGRRNEYRYVGDVYIDGFMHGEAVTQMEAKDPKRVVSKYMLS